FRPGDRPDHRGHSRPEAGKEGRRRRMNFTSREKPMTITGNSQELTPFQQQERKRAAFHHQAIRRSPRMNLVPPEVMEEEVGDPAFHPKTDDRWSELAVITAHWNFSGYKRPSLNLLRFLREMDYQGI